MTAITSIGIRIRDTFRSMPGRRGSARPPSDVSGASDAFWHHFASAAPPSFYNPAPPVEPSGEIAMGNDRQRNEEVASYVNLLDLRGGSAARHRLRRQCGGRGWQWGVLLQRQRGWLQSWLREP